MNKVENPSFEMIEKGRGNLSYFKALFNIEFKKKNGIGVGECQSLEELNLRVANMSVDAWVKAASHVWYTGDT